MIRYEIIKLISDIHPMKNGCTFESYDLFPEIIERYENEDDALNTLKSLKTWKDKYNGKNGIFWIVTEYCLTKNEYDEDGEWIGGGDILAWA